MFIKDFFRLILKLFGLYFLVAVVFTVMPGLILSMQDAGVWVLLSILITIIALSAVFLFLVFKADQIVNFFQLDRGFDSAVIPLDKIDELALIKLACILIGGFLTVDNIAPVLSNGYQLLKGSVQGDIEQTLFGATEIKQNLALNSLNLLIGYLLMTNYDRVSKWLNQSKVEKL